MEYIIIAIFLIEVVYCKGFPLLWKIFHSPKTYFDFGIPSINGLFYGLVILGGGWSLFRGKSSLKYLCLGIGILIISRQIIMSIVIEGIIFKLITLKRIRQKFVFKLAIIAIVGILVFSIIGNYRTGEGAFLAVAKFYSKYNWIPTSFKWLYSYMCFSLSNINNLVSMTNGGVNHGASTFNELVPSVLANIFNFEETYTTPYLVSINFNVSTFMPNLYLDFGFAGIGIFCFAIGLISGATFYSMKKGKTTRNCLIYSVIAHNILLLFFVNMFFYLPVIVQVIYVPLLFKKAKQRRCVVNEKSKIKSPCNWSQGSVGV